MKNVFFFLSSAHQTPEVDEKLTEAGRSPQTSLATDEKLLLLCQTDEDRGSDTQPDPGVRPYSTAVNRKREGKERRRDRKKEGGREGGMSLPLPGLSVSHRGGERQATMGPFSAWLKVVI